jgi:hypothetical protein
VLRYIPWPEKFPNTGRIPSPRPSHFANFVTGAWNGPECIYGKQPKPISRSELTIFLKGYALGYRHVPVRLPLLLLSFERVKCVFSILHLRFANCDHITIVNRVGGILNLPVLEEPEPAVNLVSWVCKAQKCLGQLGFNWPGISRKPLKLGNGGQEGSGTM